MEALIWLGFAAIIMVVAATLAAKYGRRGSPKEIASLRRRLESGETGWRIWS